MRSDCNEVVLKEGVRNVAHIHTKEASIRQAELLVNSGAEATMKTLHLHRKFDEIRKVPEVSVGNAVIFIIENH